MLAPAESYYSASSPRLRCSGLPVTRFKPQQCMTRVSQLSIPGGQTQALVVSNRVLCRANYRMSRLRTVIDNTSSTYYIATITEVRTPTGRIRLSVTVYWRYRLTRVSGYYTLTPVSTHATVQQRRSLINYIILL